MFARKFWWDMPFKVTICPASCRKVLGYPATIVVNLSENHFYQTLQTFFPEILVMGYPIYDHVLMHRLMLCMYYKEVACTCVILIKY